MKKFYLFFIIHFLIYGCSEKDYSNLPDEKKLEVIAKNELNAETVDITKTQDGLSVFIKTKPSKLVGLSSDWGDIFSKVQRFENQLVKNEFNSKLINMAIAFQYKTVDGGSSVPVKIYINKIQKIENEWDVPQYVEIQIKSSTFKNLYCDYVSDFKLQINDENLYKWCLIRYKCKQLNDKGLAPKECSPFL